MPNEISRDDWFALTVVLVIVGAAGRALGWW